MAELVATMKKKRVRSKIYSIWCAMKQRCRNPKNKWYHLYGARGITVCERWNQFSNFEQDMGERPEGFTLERINNSLGYYPENCKWASVAEQNHNRRPVNRLSLKKHKGDRLSKFVGVTFHKQCQKWQASIEVEGKTKYLGLFTDETKAASAYTTAAAQLTGGQP